jgi:hypothetical protein
MSSRGRLILSAGLCLFGGVAATALVAWACALWSGAHTPGFGFLRTTPAQLSACVPPSWLDGFLDEPPGVVRHIRDPDAEVRLYRAGWPCASLRGVLYIGAPGTTGQWGGAVTAPSWLHPNAAQPAFCSDLRAIPLVPEPLGFSLDAILFAAIFATLFIAPSRLRRSLRLRRGLCPACAYDLAGITTGVCPECGKGGDLNPTTKPTPPPPPPAPLLFPKARTAGLIFALLAGTPAPCAAQWTAIRLHSMDLVESQVNAVSATQQGGYARAPGSILEGTRRTTA